MSKSQEYIDQNISKFEEELFDLLRIPSVSTDSSKKPAIKEAANFLLKQFESFDLERVELFETPGNPIVYAEHCPHDDKPTVLVYGHYDVQPSDPDELWDSPAFEPVVKDGNVYARGASDRVIQKNRAGNSGKCEIYSGRRRRNRFSEFGSFYH